MSPPRPAPLNALNPVALRRHPKPWALPSCTPLSPGPCRPAQVTDPDERQSLFEEHVAWLKEEAAEREKEREREREERAVKRKKERGSGDDSSEDDRRKVGPSTKHTNSF